MDALMTALIRPRSLAVIGASPNRQTLGNVALDNLKNYKYAGKVVAVHAEAKSIDGWPTVDSIETLPADVETVLASVPAAGVAEVIRRLERKGVPTAIINTAGFSPSQEAELRQLVNSTKVLMHGPNCMGHINLSDATPIYTGGITPRIRKGNVALIAQSGSAAISVINSCTAGFSKVVTIGSEYRVTAADYLNWFAHDDNTAVVGLVLESIQDADKFADAVDRIHAAGKAMVVLKVGRSAIGAQATLAHTGALIRNNDAFVGFVERYGVPIVNDYEELIACLEMFSATSRRAAPGSVALMGISGGETALACDICDEIDLPLTKFSDATVAAVREILPGVPGQNPLDVGGSVGRSANAAMLGMKAIMDDAGVGVGVVLQDMQASLPESSHRNYSGHLATVVELSKETKKPLILISPTGEIMSERLLACIKDVEVPPIRGLRAGLIAAKSLIAWAARKADTRRLGDRKLSPEREALRREVADHKGALPLDLVTRLLAAYDIPVVKSGVAKSVEEAMTLAARIGYPMVVKVVS
ncbi:MAG: CoA-binding protein, partial [Acidobacteria bacterium]|nr:CoA-binding protein [Acidobacteriota bacterium]